MIAYNKCGHTTIVNTFLTPPGESIERGAPQAYRPAIRVSNEEAATVRTYRGSPEAAQEWPEPKVTITFFRNPLARALSAYQHFIVRTLRESFINLGFRADMNFSAFCLHLNNVDLNADNHLKPQCVGFQEVYAGGEVYGGQLEQLYTTWPLLVEQYGLDCTTEVAHFNAAAYNLETLTGIRREMFQKLYADDYALWEAAAFETREAISSVSH